MSRNRWISEIRKGDVLKEIRSGNLRIVRAVAHYDKRHTYVSLVIQRCSWTTRCYTVLTRHDLSARFRLVKARVSLRGKIDKAIERELTKESSAISIHCCDVSGLS